ncbi:MAG: response regulator [Balneolaceae bacterium]
MTVFIVEDDRVLSLILSRMIEKMNYNVIGSATTGSDSIQKIKELRPDLIMMDISLKDDIDGITVTQNIKQVYSPAIIYVTGNSDSKNRNRAKEFGYHEYLIKPISFEQLQSSFNSLEISN